jgi:sugar lactone lactonase YvrE
MKAETCVGSIPIRVIRVIRGYFFPPRYSAEAQIAPTHQRKDGGLLNASYRTALLLILWLAVTPAVFGQALQPSGMITTYAGSGVRQSCNRGGCTNIGGSGFAGDGGAASSALLNAPGSVAADIAGNVYVADSLNNRVRKIDAGGIISTIAGDGTFGGGGDGGPATAASVQTPASVAVDNAGNVYIAETPSHRIRKVGTDGVITTVAGNGIQGFAGDAGLAVLSSLNAPSGVAVDASGNLYIADQFNFRVRKVSPSGVISTVAGDGDPNGLAPTDVAVDAAGNLFIADSRNHRVWKLVPGGALTTIAAGPLNSPAAITVDNANTVFIAEQNGRVQRINADGTVSTVAGCSSGIFNGDVLGLANSTCLYGPEGIAVDTGGHLFIADTGNSRIRKVTFSAIPFSAGVSVVTANNAANVRHGYGVVISNTDPASLAIFGFRQNGILISEATVPASTLLQFGRIYAEVNGSINTGLALTNPNAQPVTVSFFFTDSGGNNFGPGATAIAAGGKISAFLNEAPFNAGVFLNGLSSFTGSFTFSASLPIAAVALRGRTNERSEFLMTTLPVADLSIARRSVTEVFPHFASAGGWTTKIALTNPGDTAISGTVQFLTQQGGSASQGTVESYSIPPRTSQTFETSGEAASPLTGSVRISATTGVVPIGVAILAFRNNGVTVTESGVPSSPSASVSRVYVETGGNFGDAGSIQSGIAVSNESATATTITLELSNLDGSSTGMTGTLSLPANGQTAKFLHQIPGLESVPASFKGSLRISSASQGASAAISVVGLRARYNERNDFLIATTAATSDAVRAVSVQVFFPHIVDSGGYTTQFILFSRALLSTGTLELFSADGTPLDVTLR